MFRPKRIGVVGAGNMGLQVAMFLADLGFLVYLFDRPGIAKKNLGGAVKAKLGSLTGRQRITPLDLAPDNYHYLGECDWIFEAVFENLGVKTEVNAIIAEHKKPEAFVSTNTSGISFNELARAAGPEFAEHYALTHFFNPVRVLPLLEVCGADDVDPRAYHDFVQFLKFTLGKKVVEVRDTPNFVGNRTGAFAMFLPFYLPTGGLNIADIEAIMQVLFGWRPFNTWDIVGLDLAEPVGGNVYHRAPDDPLHEWWNPKIPQVEALLAKGLIGRKGKSESGFLARDGKRKLCYDFNKGEYVPAELTGYATLAAAMAVKSQSDKLRIMLTSDSNEPDVKFAKAAFFTMAAYSANMVGRICDEFVDIDDCLKNGFNWPTGIFELVQMFGINETLAGIEAAGLSNMVPEWFAALGKQKINLYCDDGYHHSVRCGHSAHLPEVDGGIYPEKLSTEADRVIHSDPNMTILDISGRVVPTALAMITSKANAIGSEVLDGLNRAMDWCEKQNAGLVIAGQGRMFGAGANLALILKCIEDGDTATIQHLIEYGQKTLNRLCFSPIPTVAAPHGITFGGSCELCLACDQRVVNANVVMGQTELQVGVTPGWGGLTRPLKRAMQGLNPHFMWGRTFRVAEAINIINPVYTNYAWIKTSRDGYHARDMGFLGPEDVIVPAQGLGQAWVLQRAREVVQGMLISGYQPPAPFVFNLPGKAGFAKLQLAAQQGCLMDNYPVMDPAHNTICAERAAWVLCGGDTSIGDEVPESRLLELEAEAFMDVVMHPGAKAYIQQLLTKGK